MADKEVNNSKDFFQVVRVNTSGSIVAEIGTKTGNERTIKNAYDFFKTVVFNKNGEIKFYT